MSEPCAEQVCSECGRGWAYTWDEPEWQECVHSTEAEELFRAAIRQHLADNGEPVWHAEDRYATSNLRILGIVEHIYLEEVTKVFPPRPPLPVGHLVYRHYTAEGILLYVGYTSRLEERQRSHRQSATWWCESARMEVERFDTRDAALLAELDAIRTEHPLWNVQGQTR